jgi:hypothetical protein
MRAKIFAWVFILFIFGSGGQPAAGDQSLKINYHHIVFNVSAGQLLVKEIINLENSTTKTYKGKTNFSLPEGATNLTPEEGLMECCVKPALQGFVHEMDLEPGSKNLQYHYLIPYSGSKHTFKRGIDYPTQRLDVLVEGLSVMLQSTNLTKAEVFNLKDKNYQHLVGENLLPGSEVEVAIANLPSPAGSYTWSVVGIGALIIFSGLLFFYLRRPRSSYA